MSRRLARRTMKHKPLVNLFMILPLVIFISLQWWVMAKGFLIICMITLFKQLGELKKEKRTKGTASFSDRVFNKRLGEFAIAFPVNMAVTSLVTMTYKDETTISVDRSH